MTLLKAVEWLRSERGVPLLWSFGDEPRRLSAPGPDHNLEDS